MLYIHHRNNTKFESRTNNNLLLTILSQILEEQELFIPSLPPTIPYLHH